MSTPFIVVALGGLCTGHPVVAVFAIFCAVLVA